MGSYTSEDLSCKNDPDASISNEMMLFINNGLEEMAKKYPKRGYSPRPFHYWICKKQSGILPRIMMDLFKKKSDHKKRGMTSDEKAVKILANSGYGVFAEIHFEEYNIGVAELITGFARYALLGLARAIETLGFKVIYGDTDSLFVIDISANQTGDLDQIVNLAKLQYDVEFSKDKAFKVFIIPSKTNDEDSPSKKQYFGLLDNGEIYSTTLVGMKSNYPKYWSDALRKLIDADIIEEFYSNKDLKDSQDKNKNTRAATILREIFAILDRAITKHDMKFIIRDLAQTQDNKEPLSKYSDNDWHKHIFQEILEDCNRDRVLAEKKTQPHAIIPYWKISLVAKGHEMKKWTTHPEKYTLDKRYYKNALWNRVKPILDSYRFTKEECKKLKAELVDR